MAHYRFGQIQPQVQLALAVRDPLNGCGLQRLDLRLVMSGSDMLDVARPPPRGPHDLDRRRPDAVFTVRT